MSHVDSTSVYIRSKSGRAYCNIEDVIGMRIKKRSIVDNFPSCIPRPYDRQLTLKVDELFKDRLIRR